jgi:CheY-like chemotaxis protein
LLHRCKAGGGITTGFVPGEFGYDELWKRGARTVVCGVRSDYRLLVADDDPGFRETVQEILQPHFETITVGSGEEAIHIVERRVVHLVLMDVHMHELSGLQAVRIVKTIRAEIPCILITSDMSDQVRQEAVLARVYTVLQKPPSQRQLLTTVGEALRESWEAAGEGGATIDEPGEPGWAN